MKQDNIFSSFPFKIDVVYTWVDGSDPVWLGYKAKYLGRQNVGALPRDSVLNSRWVDFGTLLLSMRSVAKFMPWVNRIFLVTIGHVPEWLRSDSQIVVVRHEDFFADYVCQPTFNSHVIESQLHRIPELSEHFLYLNDDVLVCQPRLKSDFFLSNGLSKFFLSEAEFRGANDGNYIAADAAGANLTRLLEDVLWAKPRHKLKHSVFALRRSVLAEAESHYLSAFELLGRSRFRSDSDFSPISQLYPYYAYALRYAVPGKMKAAYVDISKALGLKQLIKLLTAKDYATMCVNCSDGDDKLSVRNARIAISILKRRFPEVGIWEK